MYLIMTPVANDSDTMQWRLGQWQSNSFCSAQRPTAQQNMTMTMEEQLPQCSGLPLC